MSFLIEKVASILPRLEEEGQVYLFALAKRQGIEMWDVVLSSDWSDKDWVRAVKLVVDLLAPKLEPDEKVAIARVAVLPSTDPSMQALPRSLDGVSPADNKTVTVELLGSDVRTAYVFKARRPPRASLTVSPTEKEAVTT